MREFDYSGQFNNYYDDGDKAAEHDRVRTVAAALVALEVMPGADQYAAQDGITDMILKEYYATERGE